MRFVFSLCARRTAGLLTGAALGMALALPLPAFAQNPKLDLDGLRTFAAAPAESVKIDIDERVLGMVLPILDDDPDARELLTAVKGIYVRHYSWDAPGQYQPSEVEALRGQLQRTGWVRLVEARSAREGDNADVFMSMEGGRMSGVAIVVSNPKEVTVVNIVGAIDPATLRRLSGKMGIPRIQVDGAEKRPAAAGARP